MVPVIRLAYEPCRLGLIPSTTYVPWPMAQATNCLSELAGSCQLAGVILRSDWPR